MNDETSPLALLRSSPNSKLDSDLEKEVHKHGKHDHSLIELTTNHAGVLAKLEVSSCFNMCVCIAYTWVVDTSPGEVQKGLASPERVYT